MSFRYLKTNSMKGTSVGILIMPVFLKKKKLTGHNEFVFTICSFSVNSMTLIPETSKIISQIVLSSECTKQSIFCIRSE